MKRVVALFIIIVAITGLYLRFGRLDHDLWFDEAGQFWIAKGQNHYNLDVRDGGLLQLFLNNREHNLDPPLFGLILRSWSSVNTSIIWLRILPGIFGLLTVIYIYKSLKLLNINRSVSIPISLLALVSFSFVDYAQELRAYSLGMFSTTAIFYYLLMYLLTRKNITNLIKLIIFTIIGISTQYNQWLLLPIISIFIFIKDYQSKKRNYLATFLFLIPIILVLGIIYYGQTKYQLGGFSLEYLNKYKLGTLGSLSNVITQFAYLYFTFFCYILGYSAYAHNLFYSLYNPLYSIIIGLIISLFFTLLVVTALKAINKKYCNFKISLIFYSLLLLEINCLSLFKYFPIGPNRWNLFHGSLLLINLAILLHLFIKKYNWIKIPISLTISLAIIINILSVYSHERENIYVKHIINKVPLGDTSVYLFSYNVIPTFKYHYQSYGLNDVYFSLASSESADSILDLMNFLSSHPPADLMKKNLTIIASDVDSILYDKIHAAIKMYADKYKRDIRISGFKNTYAFVLSS